MDATQEVNANNIHGILSFKQTVWISFGIQTAYVIMMIVLLYTVMKYLANSEYEHFRTTSVKTFYTFIGVNTLARIISLILFIIMAFYPVNMGLTFAFRISCLVSVYAMSCLGIQICINMAEATIYFQIIQGKITEEINRRRHLRISFLNKFFMTFISLYCIGLLIYTSIYR